MKIISSLYLVRTEDTLFDAVEFQQRYSENPFALGDAYLMTFFSTCAIALRTTHEKNNTYKYDTEGFVPVGSLNGMVGSSSSFNRYLIGSTGKILSVVYINAK